MNKLMSPNDLHQAACNTMLGGDKPQSRADWTLCVNFWAANVEKEYCVQLTDLMAKIMGCPLTEEEVAEIAKFQLKSQKRRK